MPPNLEERSCLYEALVRFDADGLVGAHACYLTEIIRDGEVIQATAGDPVPVKDVVELQKILGKAMVDYAGQVEALKAERDAARAERDAARSIIKPDLPGSQDKP